MNNTITTKNGQQLARPLKVLVPLINRDIANAINAGEMFYVAAGAKLAEARDGFIAPHKSAKMEAMEFWDWFRTKKEIVFPDRRPVAENTARTWMGQWEAVNVRGETFASQNEFRSRVRERKDKPWRQNVRKTDYHDPVKRILSGIDHDEMRKRAATAAKEHELERTLANQLIKIGYGVLATKLHPDKGGSHDAMRRLNKVAKALREVYSTTGFLV